MHIEKNNVNLYCEKGFSVRKIKINTPLLKNFYFQVKMYIYIPI